jgi:hypothetical protein
VSKKSIASRDLGNFEVNYGAGVFHKLVIITAILTCTIIIQLQYSYYTAGSRFMTELRSEYLVVNRIVVKCNLNGDRFMGQTDWSNDFTIYNIPLHDDMQF